MIRAAFVILMLCLTGCATTGQQYGNHLPVSSEVDQVILADEAINKIVRLYPPAKARFNLQHESSDAFGQALIKGLRNKGYAIHEFSSDGEKDISGQNLSYVVDRAGDTNIYLLSIRIANESISKAFTVTDGELASAGYWVRKE